MTDQNFPPVCPDCETPLTGDEVICPNCLTRLEPQGDELDLVIPKSISLDKEPALAMPDIEMSAAEQAQLRLQFFPWRKFLIGLAVAVFLGVVLVAGTVLTWFWLRPQHTGPTTEEQLAQAEQLYQQQDYEAAAEAYQTLAQRYPDLAPAYSGLGWSHYQLTHDREAFNAFQAATKLNPNLVEAQLGLGQTAYYLNKPSESITALRKTIELNPEKARAYGYLGAAYFRQKMYTDAIAPLQDAVWRDPTDGESFSMLGRALLFTNQPADAVMPLERAVELLPGDKQLFEFLAEAYIKIGDYDEAIRYSRMALRENPDEFELSALLGQALFNYGDNEGAVNTLIQAAAKNRSIHQLAGIYHILGQIAFQKGDFTAAEKYLHAAVTLDSSVAQAFTDLGWTYIELNRIPDACESFAQAIQHDASMVRAQEGLKHCPSVKP